MKKPVSSRFIQHPATRTGWWSGLLAILAMGMLILNNVGLNPFNEMIGQWQSILVAAFDLIMLGSLLAAIVLGIIAVTRKRERSWLVWLFMIPVTFLVILMIAFSIEVMKFNNDQPEVAPTPNASIERLPVIFDDDGSPDGTSALLFLLSDPRAEVRLVSISYGEAHPQMYIQYLGAMLERFGYEGIPLGAGQDAPLAGNNAFPDFVREGSNEFWGLSQGRPGKNYPVQDSAQLMVKTILQSDEPVTLLVSGALTNLALALRLEPGISDNIAAVYIMGGAVYVPGNIQGLTPESENTAAEWNIFVDPLAASEVFNSGLNLYLVPLDATNQVTLTHDDTRAWRKGGNLPDLAAEIYDTRMKDWGRDEVEMWDLVTAELMLNPQHCNATPLRLEVVVEAGNNEGQTRVNEGSANVTVCLDPDSDAIKATLAEVFSSRK